MDYANIEALNMKRVAKEKRSTDSQLPSGEEHMTVDFANREERQTDMVQVNEVTASKEQTLSFDQQLLHQQKQTRFNPTSAYSTFDARQKDGI